MTDELNSITELTAETCCIQLINALRKQIEDIEYFIHKVKGYCAQIKTGGQNEDDRKLCENRMVSTERRICTQFIFISRACINLGNAMQPVGQCTDNFIKLLIQLYVCLANLTKHFINRQKIAPISYKSTKFDQLVQTIGKKLPLKIYSMITYIENSIFDRENANENNGKKNDAKNQKARVMRDTKNIPKLIKNIENFNKFVISLSKKTEHDLNKCLHIGTVRDFRIKTKELREAIDKFRENEPDENDESDDENEMDSDDDDLIEDDEEDETGVVSVATTESGLSSSNTGSTGSIIQEVNHDASLRTSVMKNLNAINKRANKRKKRDIDNVDESENNNQRHKKRKENETVESVKIATATRRSNRRNPTK